MYLPQFHPIPENDAWWGKGFTEWTNVTKAKPLFKGHYQPNLPSELGFYDLRLHEARLAQEQLAKQYGIHGFCYYHYWFSGKRLLNEPIDRKLQNEKEDLPFMFCWANENWTRTWDGFDKTILIQQNYSHEDDLSHIQFLIRYFKDPRYIRINNKPVFAIYKSNNLPNIKKTIEIWREAAANEGLELYLCRFESFGVGGKNYVEDAGFDAAIEFQPFVPYTQNIANNKTVGFLQEPTLINLSKSFNARFHKILADLNNKIKYKTKIKGAISSYDAHIENALRRIKNIDDYVLYKGICVAWDNTPRKSENFLILNNSTPEKFYKWMIEIFKNSKVIFSEEENLFFINAWNEWAEGNYLEPSIRWGNRYLDSFKKAHTYLDNSNYFI